MNDSRKAVNLTDSKSLSWILIFFYGPLFLYKYMLRVLMGTKKGMLLLPIIRWEQLIFRYAKKKNKPLSEWCIIERCYMGRCIIINKQQHKRKERLSVDIYIHNKHKVKGESEFLHWEGKKMETIFDVVGQVVQ